MRYSEAPFWKEEINDKVNSVLTNKTWVLTNLPPCCKPIGPKRIFKRKLRTNGSIENYKARLVDVYESTK